ncbi:hypothetical protein FMM01_12660 [Schleiferilactobacillus harbinensis]|uniref:NAD(P)/FAD-dependent oxidoreductase n=1 Tax=Schleiferilactobacillus harbinensis TaxID=304207 RepID=UPI00123B7B96|nr:NAD(P)/FAD-dependent oxidoreductase [Schleiferilactobacillus harbinensis]QEU48090.1 hypothetical protein FMM01_12660 [Schleiferilactobacillus harbinensis]
MHDHRVIVIGAGPAGLGTAIALQELGVSDVQVIDQGEIGHSFRQWHPEIRFISPSFTTNGFGFPDLNAITPNSSPTYGLHTEHPSGRQYARYLEECAAAYALPVLTHTTVTKIQRFGDAFRLETNRGEMRAKYVISEVGDFSFPAIRGIRGAELGRHYAQIASYRPFTRQEDPVVIIGGGESGFDAAIKLAALDQRSVLITDVAAIDSVVPDPSIGLSPYTYQRYTAIQEAVSLWRGQRVTAITQTAQSPYTVHLEDGQAVHTRQVPILATGFASVDAPLQTDLFAHRGDRAELNRLDESTVTPNLFMVGPEVTHEGVILCYIYKYRQRFAVVAAEIAQREGITPNAKALAVYQANHMYLTDLADCAVDCVC